MINRRTMRMQFGRFWLRASKPSARMRFGVTLVVFVGALVGVASASATRKPISTQLSKIEDIPAVRHEHKATEGKLTGGEIAYAYRWEGCNVFPPQTSCMAVPQATQEGYDQTVGLAGDNLRVNITATNSVGKGAVAFAPTNEVLAPGGSAGVAWAENYPSAQLGAGYRNNYETAPVLVRDLSGIRQMIPAGEASYALLNTGEVKAWGDSGQGDIGNDEKEPAGPVESPVSVQEEGKNGEVRVMKNATSADAVYQSFVHALALVNEGNGEDRVMVWGASANGERGNGEFSSKKGTENQDQDVAISVPLLEHKHIVAITAGGDSDYALQEEEDGVQILWAWGSNKDGKLGVGRAGTLAKDQTEEEEKERQGEYRCEGDGTSALECVPRPQKVELTKLKLASGVKITAMSSDERGTYALLSTGEVLAWGENTFGLLGDGTPETNADEPTYVCTVRWTKGECPKDHLTGVEAIAAGDRFALALLYKNGEVAGWGSNTYGELGVETLDKCERNKNGPVPCALAPQMVTEKEHQLFGVTQIAAGAHYSLALANEDVYAWGSDEVGQLGIGSGEGPGGCRRSEREVVEKKERYAPCVKGPEQCGTRTFYSQHQIFTSERQCSRRPVKLGLEGVEGIGASRGANTEREGFGHSFAWLKTGEGPKPLLEIAPTTVERGGKLMQALKVNWRVASTPANEYKLRWKAQPPIEELHKKDKLEQAVAEVEEECAAVPPDKKAAECETELPKLELELKELETYLEKEFPVGETVGITKPCEEHHERHEGEWCETFYDIPRNTKEEIDLRENQPYAVTLSFTNGYGGHEAMTIVGKTG